MAKQNVHVELFYNGVWNDAVLDDEVLTQSPITIERGQGDDSKAPRPSLINCQFDNHTDKYRISNPMSPLYGKAGRSTPLRVSVGSSYRAYGELNSLEPDQTQDFRRTPRRGRAWADAQAGGLLERVNSWTDPIRSPMYYSDSTLPNLLGLWPLEDPSDSLNITSLVPGSSYINTGGASFAAGGRAPGTSDLVQLEPDAQIIFYPKKGTSSNGWQMSWITRRDQVIDPGLSPIMNWQSTSGISYFISFLDGATSIRLSATRISDGTSLILSDVPINTADLNYQDWTMFILKVSISAGTVSVGLSWRMNDAPAYTGFTSTFADTTAGNLKVATIRTNPDNYDSPKYGYFTVVDGNAQPMDDTPRASAFDGYNTERASDRFARVCTLFGLPYTVGSQAAKSTVMGPQSPGTVSDVFREIAQTDDGLVYDKAAELKLHYLSRADRYRATPVLSVYLTDLKSKPREITDMQGIYNTVTANNAAGGEYTAIDSAGPLGTQYSPNGVGPKIQKVDIDVSNEFVQLPQEANWWLKRGTLDVPRYPVISFELSVLPSNTVALLESVDIGSVINMVDLIENPLRLHVLGIKETIKTHTRQLSFMCRADQQFYTGKWDATDSKWDSGVTTLQSDVNNTATTLVFTMTDNKQTWSQTSNYDVIISGEVIGITGASVGAVTGSGPYTQTITGVARSKNGIFKNLSAGSSVHVFQPGRWGV